MKYFWNRANQPCPELSIKNSPGLLCYNPYAAGTEGGVSGISTHAFVVHPAAFTFTAAGGPHGHRQPRTIIGEYANGDLILIVVDGRQADWSSGVTLERLQVKLAELGVKEGYNLDGGGSSTFIFKGEVLNRPSDGKQRPVVTNIVIMP
jgi:hypothetical protein